MDRQSMTGKVHFTPEEEQVLFKGGEVRGLHFYCLVTRVRMLETLKEVKESRAYKAVKRSSGTWTGYCKMLGFSARRIDEDLKHLDYIKAELEKWQKELGLEGVKIDG